MTYARDAKPPYYHGTRADLAVGDLLRAGWDGNFREHAPLSHIYFSATLGAAIWGAELARGDGRQRIYIVEPTGAFEDDPNLTDKKFPGNVTASYRSRDPLRIVGEIEQWEPHPPEQVAAMKAAVAATLSKGDAIID